MQPAGLIYAGVDEAGRGPLAGPVVAAAVVLYPDDPIIGVNDSKKLTERQRDKWFDEITRRAQAFAIAKATVQEIDSMNILQASLLAMRRAVMEVEARMRSQDWKLERIHVDGNQCPKMDNMECHALVGGDGRDAAIASASILAKVTRDRLMLDMDRQYPQYEFARHKGYPTARHRALLIEFGACPEHRSGFAPVKAVLKRMKSAF
ncbi:MAG: ribonuclease HII [Halothiobacillus sp. 14-56-357]|nr:MAG: ribonuclease HII [Halothiobacillus sp. 15-55-196]OZB57221.1 MAG: ribonuclease HII [Halothiobacillus sp. 14-56-357]OZB79302.1 MAG: ribonuclease HII [Halothiobacillus sp. 13-55-115]